MSGDGRASDGTAGADMNAADRDDRDPRRQTLIDAAVAAGTLAVVVGVGWVEGVRLGLAAAGAGALGTVLFEAATLSDPERHRRVRAAWERPAVRLGAVLVTGVVVVVGAEVAPATTLSFLAGALATYLLFLAAVAVRG